MLHQSVILLKFYRSLLMPSAEVQDVLIPSHSLSTAPNSWACPQELPLLERVTGKTHF